MEISDFKRTFYGSIIVYLLLAIVFYKYITQPLLQKKKELTFLSSQKSDITLISDRIESKKMELKKLDQLLYKYNGSVDVFSEVAKFCSENQLNLEYKDPIRLKEDQIIINENEILVRGNFKSIVKLIHLMEQELGWLEDCVFQKNTVRYRNKNEERLVCTIHFKNIFQK